VGLEWNGTAAGVGPPQQHPTRLLAKSKRLLAKSFFHILFVISVYFEALSTGSDFHTPVDHISFVFSGS